MKMGISIESGFIFKVWPTRALDSRWGKYVRLNSSIVVNQMIQVNAGEIRKVSVV